MKFVKIRMLIVIISLCGCISCSSGLSKELESGYLWDGKTVELEGYMIPDKRVNISDNGEINMDLLPDLYNIGDTLATLVVPFGNDPNSCNITKDNFTSEDIEIFDDSFNKHDYKTKFKIKGTVKYTNRNWAEDTVFIPKGSIAEKAFTLMTQKNRKDIVKKNKDAALKREKETGDPNDYSFVIEVESIKAL